MHLVPYLFLDIFWIEFYSTIDRATQMSDPKKTKIFRILKAFEINSERKKN